jgi:transcriptional regulator with XRE-family HTH domain
VNQIRKARKTVGLTLKQVAAAVGMSHEWLRLAENGQIPVSSERKEQILTVIERLRSLTESFKADVRRLQIESPAMSPSFKNRKTVAKT